MYVPVYSVCPHVCRYQCAFMKSRGGVSCSITSHPIPLRQSVLLNLEIVRQLIRLNGVPVYTHQREVVTGTGMATS